MLKNLLYLFLAFSATIQVTAQQSIVTSGNSFQSSSGSVSYSLGQIFFKEISGNGGISNQGVQQPYEIYTLDVDEPIKIKFEAMVYPNPTSFDVTLRINTSETQDYSYQVFDINGRFIMKDIVSEIETIIPLNSLSSGTYILKVLSKNESFKIFKIIKN